MPVVINDFEMLPDPAPAPAAGQSTEGDHAATPARLEPAQLAPVLVRLAEQAMRVWAH